MYVYVCMYIYIYACINIYTQTRGTQPRRKIYHGMVGCCVRVLLFSSFAIVVNSHRRFGGAVAPLVLTG